MNYYPFAKLSQIKKKEVPQSSKEKFLGKCKVCGETLTYVGGNVVVCNNEKCKGVKHTKTSEDGTELVYYTPVFRLLDAQGVEIAEKLFD